MRPLCLIDGRGLAGFVAKHPFSITGKFHRLHDMKKEVMIVDYDDLQVPV